jgi:transposase-like protein
MAGMKRRKFRSEEKARIVREYEGSGMTQKQYCMGAGIAVNSLQRWKKQESIKNPGMRFVEVEGGGILEKQAPYRLEYSSGISLQFGEGFDRQEIQILARIIQELGKCST